MIYKSWKHVPILPALPYSRRLEPSDEQKREPSTRTHLPRVKCVFCLYIHVLMEKSLRKKKFIAGNCIIASLIVVNRSENAWNDWRMPLLSAAKALRVNEWQRETSESNLRAEEAFHKHTLNLLFQRNSLLCTSLGACHSCFTVIEEALLRGLKRESLIYITKLGVVRVLLLFLSLFLWQKLTFDVFFYLR